MFLYLFIYFLNIAIFRIVSKWKKWYRTSLVVACTNAEVKYSKIVTQVVTL